MLQAVQKITKMYTLMTATVAAFCYASCIAFQEAV